MSNFLSAGHLVIRADELTIGDRVLDDFQPWARVTELEIDSRLVLDYDQCRIVVSVLVGWTLTDGTTERDIYPADARFTRYEPTAGIRPLARTEA